MLTGQKINLATKRVLLFHNVFLESIKQKYGNLKSYKDKNTFSKVIRSNILKKYRVQEMAKASIGTTHRQISNEMNSALKKNQKKIVGRLKSKVEEFLCRDDNSILKAVKKATKTKNGQKKHLLTDSLKTLHSIFLAENIDSQMSYALKLKPFYIRHPTPGDRETCLCKRHENLKFWKNC
jgi:predicted CopG family antitoxin